MGQQQSKDELLYEQVIVGNVEAIKALCAEGAGLEWIDKEGKTPLIVACMNPELFIVVKTLIELGANVNAYRPGRHAGTPLHHAAKRGLGQTVKFLLSSGANPLVRNDDCQTPLDVARMRGFSNVVRAIETHICFFSGWLREFYGPGFLEALAPQLLLRKIWAVIVPRGSYNPTKPLKLELAIYSTLQHVILKLLDETSYINSSKKEFSLLKDAQPCTVVALWKANIEEQKFHQPNPALIIFDKSTKTRYKFAPANDGDRQQLECLYNACRGTPQVVPPPVLPNTQSSVPATATQTATEAADLAMAINASIQPAMGDRPPLDPNNHPCSEANNLNGWGNTTNDTSHNGWGTTSHDGWGAPGGSRPSEASSSGWIREPAKEEYNGWCVPVSGPTSNPSEDIQAPDNVLAIVETSNAVPALVSSAPSAPPVPEDILDEGPVHYPSVDLSPVDLSIPSTQHGSCTASEAKDEGGSSSCVICWEAPVEGACIPCGHMAGCISCLNEIKTKKGDCPVCRAKINQIIRLYAV